MPKGYSPKASVVIDEGDLIRSAFRNGKKSVMIGDREFNIRKITKETHVQTKAHPEGVKVKEHWLVVTPVIGMFPRGQVAYPYTHANSRSDLV